MPISVSTPFAGTFTVTQTPTGLYSHTDDYVRGQYRPAALVDYWTAAYDFGLPEGTALLAVASGVVVDYREDLTVGQTGAGVPSHGLGNFVTIRFNAGTSNEFYATYAHLKTNGVLVEGGAVQAGQIIGYSGATGAGTGAHLHFQFSKTSFTHKSGDILAYATDAYDSLITFGGRSPGVGEKLTGTAVSSAKADLVPVNSRIGDTTPDAGQKLDTFWDISNKGNGAAAASSTGIYLSKDAMWSSDDIRLGGESTSALAAGASDTAEDATITIPVNFAAGSYFLLFVADEEKLINEGSESNNVFAHKITVSKPASAHANLVADNFRLDDRTVHAGDRGKAMWDSANKGGAEAGSSTQLLILSKDRKVSSDDIALDTESLGSLSPGEIDSEYEYFYYPKNVARGRWEVGLIVDAAYDVLESNEADNIVWTTVEIL